MTKPFDMLLYNEMVKEDDDDLLDLDDDALLDSLMESTSINEELLEIFPPEEKYEEV